MQQLNLAAQTGELRLQRFYLIEQINDAAVASLRLQLGHALIQRALCLGDLIAQLQDLLARFLVIEQPAWALAARVRPARLQAGQQLLVNNGAGGVRNKGIGYSPA